MLQPTGLAVLERLGLAGKAARRGSRIDGLFGLNERGEPALDSPYSGLSAEAFGIGIHRASLFDILFDAVTAAGIAIKTGHEIVGTTFTPHARRLEFADETSSAPFDLLVDATGWRTPLAGPTGGVLDFGALWATLPLEPGDPFAGNLLEQRYRRASQMVGVLPIGQGQAAFFWSLRGDAHQEWRNKGLACWKDEVRALWPETDCMLGRIESADQLTFARYAHRQTRSAMEPRLMRIGDSWHSASPQLGQGANMALLDAWGLAQGLEQGRTLDEGLRLAQGWRGDHVWLYQLVTRFFTPLFQSDEAVWPMLRDRAMMPLSRIWPFSRIQAQMMSGMFGFPLQQLGLGEPDYGALASASSIAPRTSGSAQSTSPTTRQTS